MIGARQGEEILEVGRALEEAAKMICILKCGRCPLGEKTFQGCPGECNEEVRPWQCWVAHFIELARAKETRQTKGRSVIPQEGMPSPV